MYEIRDPIHQTIYFSEREKTVIDHPAVQRLRFVKQLGLSFLVYPGASHDRFSHALGAMHLAGRVWDRILETSGETLSFLSKSKSVQLRQLLRFAALLHDVGHAPFSHVSERFMPELKALDLPRDWFKIFESKRRACHEDYSVLLVHSLSRGANAIFTRDEAQDIASLIHEDAQSSKRFKKFFGKNALELHQLLHELISGEIDCDRMDYLLRDAHNTGVAYGYFDLDHIIRNLGAIRIKSSPHGKKLVLTIDSTAVRAFEDFLLARYHMFLQVYLHKTTLVFDYFLEQAILKNEISFLISGTAVEYLALRDSVLLEKIFAAAEDKNNFWSNEFLLRRPAKLIFSASGIGSERRLIIKLRTFFKKNKIPFFTVNSKQYLSKMLRKNQGGGKSNFSRLLVRRKFLGGINYEPIERYSSLLKKYNETINLTNLYVLRGDYNRAIRIISRFPQSCNKLNLTKIFF